MRVLFPTEPIRWDRGYLVPITTGIERDADGMPVRIYLSNRSGRSVHVERDAAQRSVDVTYSANSQSMHGIWD